MKTLTALISLTTLGTALTFATNASANWSGGIEAGAHLSSDQSPAFRLYANHQGNPLSQYIYLDWIRNSGSSSYRLGYNPTYAISQSLFSFGEFSIEQDDPGSIAREIDARIGVGNHLFRTKNSRFTINAGVGGTKVDFADSSKDTSEGFFFAGGLFTSKLIGLLRFDASVEATTGESLITTDGEAGVSLRVGPNTSLKYVATYERYDFESGDEDIVNTGSFFTISRGF